MQWDKSNSVCGWSNKKFNIPANTSVRISWCTLPTLINLKLTGDSSLGAEGLWALKMKVCCQGFCNVLTTHPHHRNPKISAPPSSFVSHSCALRISVPTSTSRSHTSCMSSPLPHGLSMVNYEQLSERILLWLDFLK